MAAATHEGDWGMRSGMIAALPAGMGLLGGGLLGVGLATAQVPANGGPYNAGFLPGGIGIERPVAGPVTQAGAPYSVTLWVKADARQPGIVPLVALGDARVLALRDGRAMLADGGATLAGPAIAPGRWTQLAAVSDGTRATLYVDGRRVASGAAPAAATAGVLHVARAVPSPRWMHWRPGSIRA